MGVMLFRAGTQECVWGYDVDLLVVEDDDLDDALADGWVRSPELTAKAADTNGDGEVSIEEAKAYLDSIGEDYSGLHWKKVVALAKEKMGDK